MLVLHGKQTEGAHISFCSDASAQTETSITCVCKETQTLGMCTPDQTFNAIRAAVLEGDDTKTKFFYGFTEMGSIYASTCIPSLVVTQLLRVLASISGINFLLC